MLLSVTEGEDKPLKYSTIFHTADVAIITKTDLSEAVEFDWDKSIQNIEAVRPAMKVMPVPAMTCHGITAWLEFLAAID